MNEQNDIGLMRQMLSITQRRIDRKRRELRQATAEHESSVQACERALAEKEQAHEQAPVRRKEMLTQLMERSDSSSESAGLAEHLHPRARVTVPASSSSALSAFRRGAEKSLGATSALESYSKARERLQKELVELSVKHKNADEHRTSCEKHLEQAQDDLRAAVIRNEKWIALGEELSQPSFEG